MRFDDFKLSHVLIAPTIIMAFLTLHAIEQHQPHVSRDVIFMIGCATTFMLLISVICLIGVVLRVGGIDLECVLLIGIVVILATCSYCTLILHGSYDTTYEVLVGFGGLI